MANSPELVKASLQGDIQEVRRLVASGADVNSFDEHGMGPLLTFTPDCTRFLLDSGANPNRQTNENRAPVLSGIAYVHNLDCVRLLLDGGADPNATHPDTGETALHSVLAHDHDASPPHRHQIVQLLISHGAEPNSKTIPGVPTAAFWGCVKTRGETPLHRAAAFATEETIRYLIDSGADASVRDSNGETPQMWAGWHWRGPQITRLLTPQE